jgi:phage shock protein A
LNGVHFFLEQRSRIAYHHFMNNVHEMERVMFATMKTLFAGASARAEENLRDQYSIELIDQKIREAQAQLSQAKVGLAHLIQRERGEARQVTALETRIEEMTARAQAAFDGGRTDMAQQGAQAIADMENELEMRRQTVERLETRIEQLRTSVEKTNRRIIDLKQGAIAAKGVRREQDLQRKLGRHCAGTPAIEEAEALVERVLGKDDPFEQSQILAEIDQGLDHTNLDARMADAGFGPKGRATANDVMARLKTKK